MGCRGWSPRSARTGPDRRTGGEVVPRPGSLYRVLDRLTRRTLVEPTDDARAASSASTDERRAYYALTDEGRAAVRTEAAMLESLARRVLAEGEGHA